MSRREPWTDELHRLRAEIDASNREILAHLKRRAELVGSVAELKEAHGLPAHDPRREEEMLRKLAHEAAGLLTATDVRAIFSAIFHVGLEIQRRRPAPGASSQSVS